MLCKSLFSNFILMFYCSGTLQETKKLRVGEFEIINVSQNNWEKFGKLLN